MDRSYTKTLLITANVGSIFEDPEKMLQLWMQEFLSTIKRIDPDFLAVHCQEVGGKNYEESMQHVNSFIKTLLASEEMQQFDKTRIFLDEDFTAVDKFTALGNLYFIHQSLKNVQIFDWEEKKFVAVKGREVLSGNIENVTIKEKAKFPQEFFPDFKWSRKGFLRTRWNVNDTVFDLVNIHLFHDANNIIAMESNPSCYSISRKNAFQHTLERFEKDEYEKCPYYIFGDFNFRLDSHGLIKRLTAKTLCQEVKGKKSDVSKMVYTDNGRKVLTLEKKGFDHHDYHSEVFSNNNNTWLHEYDREPATYKDHVFEYEVTFPPSYPFSEDVEDGTSYMKTRCPAWCDRVLLNYSAKEIMVQEPIEYNMMGPNVCMGDHKPIYLNFKLLKGQGNETEQDSVDELNPVISQTHKPPLKKVISINGEEVQFEPGQHTDVNIFDYSHFEREPLLSKKFRGSMKRPPHKSVKLTKQRSFKDLAQNIIRAETVIHAMKHHYAHRSDSEDSDVEDGEKSQGKSGSKKSHRSSVTEVSESELTSATPTGADTKEELFSEGTDTKDVVLVSEVSTNATNVQPENEAQIQGQSAPTNNNNSKVSNVTDNSSCVKMHVSDIDVVNMKSGTSQHLSTDQSRADHSSQKEHEHLVNQESVSYVKHAQSPPTSATNNNTSTTTSTSTHLSMTEDSTEATPGDERVTHGNTRRASKRSSIVILTGGQSSRCPCVIL